jgi:hypothetical protein
MKHVFFKIYISAKIENKSNKEIRKVAKDLVEKYIELNNSQE